MKIKSLVFGFCISFCSFVFAAQHSHPDTESAVKKNAIELSSCAIRIVNNSFDNVTVTGIFDDGVTLAPFTVYSYGMPEYIDMFYYGYCHAGMNLYISTWDGYNVFAGYAYTGNSIYIVPYLKQVKAEVRTK